MEEKEWGLPQETLCGNKHGGLLHQFECASCTAWIVEPPEPLADRCRRWFWVPEWPNAFPARNGVRQLLSLGFTILQTMLFRWSIDEKKLLEEMEANAKKRGNQTKKSGFMARLEAMQREQQRMARENAKAQAKKFR